MRRGDVWWGNLPEPVGRRPVVLVSRDSAYAVRLSVTVAPVTTRIRGIPTEVPLGPEDGLDRVSVANFDDLITITKDLLDTSITSLGHEKVLATNDAIRFALGLDNSP